MSTLLSSQIEEKLHEPSKASSWVQLKMFLFRCWYRSKCFYLDAVRRMGGRWRWLKGRVMKKWNSLVGSDGLLNPVHIVADLGVDPRLVFLGAAIAPRDNTLELSIADHGATRVTLSKKEEPVRTVSCAQMGENLQDVPFILYPGTTFQGGWSSMNPFSFPGNATLSLRTSSLFFLLLLYSSPLSLGAGPQGQEEGRTR